MITLDTLTYWEEREKDRLTTEMMADEEVNERIKVIINGHMERIINDIESFYHKYADEAGISNATAKKMIDNLDMEHYEKLAQYYVKNRHDKELAFSDEANRQMKIYNVTMKINREKLILAEMFEHLKNMGVEIEAEMKDYLEDSTIREFERQAGILGSINLSRTQFEAIINSTHLDDNKIWSERLWKNVVEVRKEVDKTIKDSLLRGRHPKESVSRLRELTGRSDFEARRLLLTETTRVQSEAQLLSMKEKNTKKFIFLAQIDDRTTVKCRHNHKEVFELKKAKIGLNVPPLHQFCRSSIAPHISPEVVKEGGGIFNIFEDDEPDEEFEEISGSDDGSLDELERLLDKLDKKTGKDTKRKNIVQQMLKERIEEQVQEPEPLKPVLSEQLKSKMEQKYIDQAQEFLDNAPEVAQKVWVKYSDRMTLGRTTEKGAHYHPTTKLVNLDLQETFDNDGKLKAKGDTFFHEFAHSIDDLAYRDHRLGRAGHFTQQYYSEKYNMTWEEVIQKEVNDLINKRNKEFKKLFEEDKLNSPVTNYHFGKWRKSLTYELLQEEFRKQGAYETSAFSDIFSGVTKNKLRIYWGHSTNYWKSHGNIVAFEAFANLFGAIMTSYETYQNAKEVIPQTVEVFEELLNYLGGEEE